MNQQPTIAILGAGIFVRTQYIPRLSEISDLVSVKYIWSRSQESAEEAVGVAHKYFPLVEAKWGESGLDDIIRDASILGVAVVLAGQTQVDISLKLLKAGKHVLQEKPAAASVREAETALSCYNSICAKVPGQPIWAVAEYYRFEPAFVESKKLMAELGEMMSIQVIVEGSMNSSNPYFSSTWRRNFNGGFVLDMGVHFIAGLRMLVGSEVDTVSATTSHVDRSLPPPDIISSLFQLENGCSGVFVMVVSSKSPKIVWRIVGLNGTLQVERGNQEGKHGYLVSLSTADGQTKNSFYPFSGVTEELKAFIHDITHATLQVTLRHTMNANGQLNRFQCLAASFHKKDSSYEAEPRSSFLEGARDIAVLEAMLESGMKQGIPVKVQRV